MENVVSLWLTLNGSSWGPGATWTIGTLPADAPRVRLAADTVTALLRSLCTSVYVNTRTHTHARLNVYACILAFAYAHAHVSGHVHGTFSYTCERTPSHRPTRTHSRIRICLHTRMLSNACYTYPYILFTRYTIVINTSHRDLIQYISY